MIRYILSIFVIIILCSLDVYAKDNFIFRKTCWGMSPKEVINSEKTNNYKINGNIISFKNNILNHKVNILYYFDNYKLIGSQIIFYDVKSEREQKNIIENMRKKYIVGCTKILNHYEKNKNPLVVTKLAGSENEETYECKQYIINFHDFYPPSYGKPVHQIWFYFRKK